MSYNPYGGSGGYPQYPAGGQGGYPGGPPAYPPTNPASGAPGQPAAGHPYPDYPGGYPGGYPSQPAGYPGQQPSYPGYPGQGGSYPGQGGGYPGQGSGYPGQGIGYPSQGSGYPGQGGGYPGQQSAYPGQQPGYPAQGGGYPGQSSGYPGQAGGHPGQPAGYPGGGHPGPKVGSHAPTAAGRGAGPYHSSNRAFLQKVQGTIRPAPSFSPEEDASALRKAMKGFGTNEQAIIDVLCRRSNAQRQEIAARYKAGYGRDLMKDLKSELGGNFEDVILALMTPPFEYLAKELHEAMSGAGTDEDCLFETLCTHSNAEINGIKSTYQKLYGKSLEESVRSESSSNFKKLLTAILQARRDESGQVDEQKAASQAQALYKAGEKKTGTDEETFTVIVATQSPAQLHAILCEYEKLSKKSLLEAVQSETSGDYRQALLAVIKSSLNRPAYFAERIRDTMKGAGTRDGDLIRLVVSRAEYDLANIKQEYLRRYGHALEKDVSSETSGDFKRALVMIIEGN